MTASAWLITSPGSFGDLWTSHDDGTVLYDGHTEAGVKNVDPVLVLVPIGC